MTEDTELSEPSKRGVDLGRLKSFAGKAQQGAKAGFVHTRAKASTLTGDLVGKLPLRNKSGVDIAELEEAAKLRYCRLLVQLAFADGHLDPREIANLYLFSTTIGLDVDARSDLRRELTVGGRSLPGAAEVDAAVVESALQLRDVLSAEDGVPVFMSVIRDLVRMSRADGEVSPLERAQIVSVAKVVFPFDADQVVAATEELVDAEEKLALGQISTATWERTTKDVIAKAAAFGAPLGAVSLFGSVSGLGAAGITSGLATLGFGGLLGLSSMVTGIGVIVLLGVGVFVGTRYVLGFNERERDKRREHLIQQVILKHQEAMADLSEDVSSLAGKVDDALTSTTQNEERVTALRQELAAFREALSALAINRDAFEQDTQPNAR